MHLHSSTGNSMTLSWTPPERPNGIILDYEIKYSEKVKHSGLSLPLPLLAGVWGRGAATGGPERSGDTPVSPLQQGQSDGIANTVTSQKNSVRLDGLKANARYMVQVRARTVAGYGRYSLPTEFQTTAEDGRYRDRAASRPPAPQKCSLPSLTLIPASPSPRLHREDFPGAASDRGLGHCGAALRHRRGRHRYRLLQVLALQGAGLRSRLWGLLTPAGRAPAAPVTQPRAGPAARGSRRRTVCLCLPAPALGSARAPAALSQHSWALFSHRTSGRGRSARGLPEGKLSGFGCLCWDLEAGSTCLCPIRKGMVTEHLLSSPLGRKQRNSTDPEYTEKLQQYGEWEPSTWALPALPQVPCRARLAWHGTRVVSLPATSPLSLQSPRG